jgi:hypothetical protein
MDKQDYLAGIGELYAAEVLGEALANRWLELATDPIERYKIGLFLQLESEAKVRLRAMAALAPLCLPYANRFQSLLEVAPPEDAPLLRFMIDHELSVSGMAKREAQGESAFSSDLVVKLEHPFAYVG